MRISAPVRRGTSLRSCSRCRRGRDGEKPRRLAVLNVSILSILLYMKEKDAHTYAQLLMADRLVPYLQAFNAQAEERMQRLAEQMKRAEGVTEGLKARDPMEWVRRMSGIAARAEEAVLQEMVYR